MGYDIYSNAGSRGSLCHWLRCRLLQLIAVMMLASLCLGQAALADDDDDDENRWLGSWATNPRPQLEDPIALFFPPVPSFDNQTVRQIVKLSIGGDRIRIRFDNTFGDDLLTIGAASVGIQDPGTASSVKSGTLRQITFDGESSVTLARRGIVFSDPVDLSVSDREHLAISVYLADATEVSTLHFINNDISFISSVGDFTAAETMSVASTTPSSYWLSGVDVEGYDEDTQVVVAIGDSITDSVFENSLPDFDAPPWPDELSRRLNEQEDDDKVGVLNVGMGGGTIKKADVFGPNIIERFDREVLVQSGVTHVILFAGVNDILVPNFIAAFLGDPVQAEQDRASADEIIAAIRQLILRAHNRGLKIYGATITPFTGGSPGGLEEEEHIRQTVNDFIRNSGEFDGVIDFDEALRDPNNPLQLNPVFNSGDNLHPNAAGHLEMGRVIDLELFSDDDYGDD